MKSNILTHRKKNAELDLKIQADTNTQAKTMRVIMVAGIGCRFEGSGRMGVS